MQMTDFHQYYSGSQCLVAGGAGFLGSNICEQLLTAGAKVTVVDNLLTGYLENLEEVEKSTGKTIDFIQQDICKSASTYLPNGYTPDYVFHFASPASPPRYQQHPLETYQVNTWATHYLLEYIQKHAPKAVLLYASTSEIYGDPLVHPQPENYWGNVNPNGLRSCYDEAKRLGETICGIFHSQYQVDARIVRIFNTYGPRIDVQDGRVIPNLLWAALNHQPLTIYGDGKQTRSYCYVSDLVRGILQVAGTPKLAGETFNLGSPDEHTILETAEIIQRLFAVEHNLSVEFLPLPKDDPTRRRPDISKIKQQLGWEPQVGFEDGLRQTAAYFQQKMKNITG